MPYTIHSNTIYQYTSPSNVYYNNWHCPTYQSTTEPMLTAMQWWITNCYSTPPPSFCPGFPHSHVWSGPQVNPSHQCQTQTFSSSVKPDTMNVSVEFGSSKPRYQASSGDGDPVASHCRVIDWPTASDISRNGPEIIDGASAKQHSQYTADEQW